MCILCLDISIYIYIIYKYVCVCQCVHCVHGISQQPLTYGRSQWLGHYREYSCVVQRLFGFIIIDGESDCECDFFSWPGIVTVNDSDILNWSVADPYFPVSVADVSIHLPHRIWLWHPKCTTTWFVNFCGRGKTKMLQFLYKRLEVSQPIRSVMPFQECQTLGEFHAGFAWWASTNYSTSCFLLSCERVVAFPGCSSVVNCKKWISKHVLSSAMFRIFLDISGYLYSSCILLWRFRCFTVNLCFFLRGGQ